MILKTKIAVVGIFFSFIVSMPSYGMYQWIMKLPKGGENAFCVMEIRCGAVDQNELYNPQEGRVERMVSFVADSQGNKLGILMKDRNVLQEDYVAKKLYDGSMEIWDIAKKKKLDVPSLRPHEKTIDQACFDQTGTLLARNSDKNVYLYDFNTQKQKSLFTHDSTITAMCFTQQSILALGDKYGQIVIVDKDGRVVRRSNVTYDNPHCLKHNCIKAMCYNEKISSIGTISFNNRVCIFNDKLEKREPTSQFNMQYSDHRDIHKICDNADGNCLMVVMNDQKSIHLINTEGERVRLVDKPTKHSSLLGIYFEAEDKAFKLLLLDDRLMLPEQNVIQLYDGEEELGVNAVLIESDFRPLSAIVDPSGKYLAVAGEKLGELLVRVYDYKKLIT